MIIQVAFLAQHLAQNRITGFIIMIIFIALFSTVTRSGLMDCGLIQSSGMKWKEQSFGDQTDLES